MVDKGAEGQEQTNLIDIIGPSLKRFSADMEGFNVDEDKVDILKDLAKVFEKFGNSGDPLAKFAESLTATGDAFSKFSQGFGNFAGQIEKFMKFEYAFSNLVKNQSEYKFNKFATDMGVLKQNVNSFNVENLKLTDSLMKSVAVLSKSDKDLGQVIKNSIDEAMQRLVAAIEKIAATPPPPVAPPPGTPTPAPGPPGKPGPTPPNLPAPPPLTALDIQGAFYGALLQYKVKQKGDS